MEAILYHGTSLRSLICILRDDEMRPGEYGTGSVSFSADLSTAMRFASYAVDYTFLIDGDEELTQAVIEAEQKSGSIGAILKLDRSALAASHELATFSDPIWGEGECDEEAEEAVFGPVTGVRSAIRRIGFNESALTAFLEALPAGSFRQSAEVAAAFVRSLSGPGEALNSAVGPGEASLQPF